MRTAHYYHAGAPTARCNGCRTDAGKTYRLPKLCRGGLQILDLTYQHASIIRSHSSCKHTCIQTLTHGKTRRTRTPPIHAHIRTVQVHTYTHTHTHIALTKEDAHTHAHTPCRLDRIDGELIFGAFERQQAECG